MSAYAATSTKNYAMENIKGIIFDYGGTLDSRGDHWSEVIYDAYRACGIEVSYEDFREAYIHGERTLATNYIVRPEYTFLNTLSAKAQIQLNWLVANKEGFHFEASAPLEIATYCDNYARASIEDAKVLLDRMAEHYPLVLVSNFYGNLVTVLRQYGLLDRFRGIVESSVIGIRKPDPRIFSVGCTVLDMAPEQVLVVGDSIDKDLIPASRIGCRTAWVEGRPWRGTSPTLPADLNTIAKGTLENIANTLLT